MNPVNDPDDKSDRFSPPPEAALIISKDGTVRRGDGKPLTDYDRGLLAAEEPMRFQLDYLSATTDQERKAVYDEVIAKTAAKRVH